MEAPLVFNDEITKAIGAHGTWKVRLGDAIAKGASDANVADVARDNKCAFGTWLYSPDFPAAQKASPVYRGVVQLHAEFHKEAANVLRMALNGERERATEAMAIGSAYARASTNLVNALTNWRQSAAA
jgi:methyl-accepting chemotaxis protein